MMIDKITEYTVYETPDGGKSIYARVSGQTQRIKISESNEVKNARVDFEESQLWESIRNEAKNNEALREAMNRVIVLYHLAKDQNGKE